MPWSSPPAPTVTSAEATFRLADPGPDVEEARLIQEVVWPREGPRMRRCEPGFLVVLARPPVNRMEYLFQLRYRDGGHSVFPDPGNPLRAPGPFGDKSVIEFPEYEAPAWTRAHNLPRGRVEEVRIPCPILRASMGCRLWTSAGADRDGELPLLIALDGFEYDLYSGLTQMLDYEIQRGTLPPMRAALLHPIRRDRDYSASPDFTHSLVREVLPEIERLVAVRHGARWRVGMGASLGGLAMLFAQWTMPELLGGLFLQSASVFNHHYFSADLGFEHMERICNFTERVHTARFPAATSVVTLTCGVVEETLLANTAMAASLVRLGYHVNFHRLSDAHNWIAWRDALDPLLVELLGDLWL